MTRSPSHLLWIPAGGTVAFLASFVFGDRLVLPLDLYYLIYFTIVLAFLGIYKNVSALEIGGMVSRRVGWGVVLGVVVGLFMLFNVLGRPETAQFSGWMLAWAILWRGLIYGSVDGILLFAFPWVVTWRAFGAESGAPGRRVLASVVALGSVFFITTIYHLGYADFRSAKILQPNIGSTITAVPTLVTANPVASPIAHVFLHVAAVIHSPHTDLFLPPHRETPGSSGSVPEGQP